MNIFVISRGTPSSHDPQWGCFEYDQANALAGLGHKVTILSVDGRFRFYFRKIGITKHVQDKLTIYNVFLIPSIIVRLLTGENGLLALRTWLLKKIYNLAVAENGKPDILFSHYVFITREALALRQAYHIPLVAIEHWSELQKKDILPAVRKMSEAYQEAEQVITVSESLRKALKEHFHVNACVVNNMVGDEFGYSPSSRSKCMRFVTAGSLKPIKGYDLLIQAFAQVQIPKAEWHLSIIGSGAEKTHLQHLIQQVGLQENIMLVGQKNKQEIVKIYHNSDVFICSSHLETFGVAAVEAMACGLPVIATKCGGPEEFVTPMDGLLVPVANIEELAKGIKHMFLHYRDYNQQAIASHCHERFASEVIAQQLTHIFEQVIARQKQ